MRLFGISLYVIIALFFAVHAVRSQQNMYWLLILFLFPGLGSAVYFFVIYLPSLRQSRGARVATRAISQAMPPKPWSITKRLLVGRSHPIRLYSKGWRVRNLPAATRRPRGTRWKNCSPPIPSPASSRSLPCCMHGPWPQLAHPARAPRSKWRSPAQATLHLVACTPIG
jgi:hypothetical protein